MKGKNAMTKAKGLKRTQVEGKKYDLPVEEINIQKLVKKGLSLDQKIKRLKFDLDTVKVVQVENLKSGDVLNIIESKTGKDNILVINCSVYKALQLYLKECKPASSDYLFKSRKGSGHISSQSVGRMVKSWTADINLNGQYGAHTLRKTWGYHQRVNHGAGFEILCKRYHHSSPAITMRYLGIEDKEICNLLMNEIG
jgi:site-specific recombinase XerD